MKVESHGIGTDIHDGTLSSRDNEILATRRLRDKGIFILNLCVFVPLWQKKNYLAVFMLKYLYVFYPGVAVAFAAGLEVVVDKGYLYPADTRSIYTAKGSPTGP